MINTQDWYRLAQPQDDGFDTDRFLIAACRGYNFVKSFPEAGEPAWLGGKVRLGSNIEPPGPGLTPAPTDCQAVLLGEEYLRTWPACFTQAQLLLQTVFVFDWAPAMTGARGCMCGTAPQLPGKEGREDGSPFGEVFSTAFDPLGFVEGVVHEMAHWKLHALGIHFEDWDETLLLNAMTEEYVSSVRKDKLRPMGAVLHAHWVYVHVLALDVASWPQRPEYRDGDLANLRSNVARTVEGQATIAANARWTPEGQAFWDGIQAWTNGLLAAAAGLHV